MTQTELTPTASLTGKWKPYPAYKDSGVEWLGGIPEQWRVMRLKFIAAEPLKYGANESAELNDPNLPRYIRITDISEDGSLRNDTYKSLPEEIAEPYLLKKGDLLFARSGATVGKSILYHESWGNACYAGYLIRLRINSHISNPNFISYFVTSSAYQNWLSSVFIQATIQNVSAEKYANLLVPVPSLPEQRAIITFLNHETARINALIAKKERLIELLQEKRAALISHAVTMGLDPMVPMKDSGVEWLGEIPAHWEVKKLKFVTSFVTSGSRGWAQYYSDEGAIFLRIGNLSRTSISLDLEDIQHVSPPEGAEGERTRVKLYDVLVSITANIGSIAVVSEDLGEAYVNQHVALARPYRDVIDSKWFGYCLLSRVGQEQFYALLYGGTKDGLGLDDVRNLSILIPTISEQRTIATYLDYETAKIGALVSRIHEGIEKLKEYSTALISAAVTGKIDVRDEFTLQGDENH